ncbi:MAG: AAA family ATPase [Candidatus Micrarchaeota archaeon]
MPLKVIGLTGTIASGKGEAKKIIVAETNAIAFSLSDLIRDEIRARGKGITRQLMREVGAEIRENEGAGALSTHLIPFIEDLDGAVVVESIRNPVEITVLREAFKKNFVLLAVDAPFELRFKRASERDREGEKKTLEEFKEVDDRELGKGEAEAGHNIAGCLQAADYVISNDGSLDDLKKKVRGVLADLKLAK